MNPNSAHILTINGGSSSIKFALYRMGEPLERRTYGKIDRIGSSGTNLTFNDPTKKERQTRNLVATDHSSAVTFLIDWLEEQPDLEATRGVGHRVVHGMQHTAPKTGHAGIAQRAAPHHPIRPRSSAVRD